MKKKLLFLIAVLAGALVLYAAWLFYEISQTGKLDQAARADAIAVLGAAEYAGKPSPVFEARLNHAYELYIKNLAPLIITTGGTHPGEKFSEGEVGKMYLGKRDVPDSAIIAETNSMTTKQNIARIAEIAEAKNLRTIIIVSDPFHMYRAGVIAGDLGLSVLLSPTAQSPIARNKRLELQYIGREMLLTLIHKFFDA